MAMVTAGHREYYIEQILDMAAAFYTISSTCFQSWRHYVKRIFFSCHNKYYSHWYAALLHELLKRQIPRPCLRPRSSTITNYPFSPFASTALPPFTQTSTLTLLQFTITSSNSPKSQFFFFLFLVLRQSLHRLIRLLQFHHILAPYISVDLCDARLSMDSTSRMFSTVQPLFPTPFQHCRH